MFSRITNGFPIMNIDYLAEKGITFLRLIFSWEILQPSLYGDFDGNYLGTMNDLIDYAVSKNMSVMIEPHGGASENFAGPLNGFGASKTCADTRHVALWLI
jgi:aryl-phospho-beta-D-glucosidase BglC (GH1 family)